MSDRRRVKNVIFRLAIIVGVIIMTIFIPVSRGIAAVKIGMVLQASGEIFPPAKQFSQLLHQKSFDLADGAFMELAIYAECNILQLHGPGVLSISDELLWSGRKPIKNTNNGCIKPLVYSNPDLQKAGINLRGPMGLSERSRLQPDEVLKISSDPIIVFDDFRAADGNTLTITGSDEKLVIELKSAVTRWPKKIGSLVPGKSYQLTFKNKRHLSEDIYKARIRSNSIPPGDRYRYLVVRFQ